MSRKTAIIVGISAVPAFIMGGILGFAGGSGRPQAEAAPAKPAVTVTVPGPVITVKVPGPVRTVRVPGPVKTVIVTKQAAALVPSVITGIGQWTVGVDMPPGVYKVTAAVDPTVMCYWKITQTGKPKKIIANDIVEHGSPMVTVKRGQDFTTEDCGTWARVR